jgi:hypothetical protein
VIFLKTKLLIKKIVCICLIFALNISNNFLHETQKINKVYAADLTNSDIPAWDGTTIATSFAGGDGSQDDPYQISNGEELAFLAKVINDNLPDENGIDYNYNGNYFELTNDIDLANKEWIPIGNSVTFNTSYFNGNNHNIYNLAVTTKDRDFYGLFGCVIFSVVHDINIVDCNININSSTYCIGTLAGEIISSNIFNCCASGTIISSNDSSYIGGLVGYYITPNGEIYNCVANVDINLSASVYIIGGLFGKVTSGYNIHDCCYMGNIKIINDLSGSYIAGLIGYTDGGANISNSYSIGSITAQNCNNSCIAGLIAGVYTPVDVTNCYSIVDINVKSCSNVGGLIAYSYVPVELNNCFSSCNIVVGEVSSGNVGGLIGAQFYSFAITNCYSAHGSILIGSTSADSYVGGLIGNDDNSINSLTNCYSGNIVKVFSPSAPNNIGSFIGETNAQVISNCYFDKDLSEYVSASEKDNENIIGLTTKQMTGYSALENMSGLFEVTDSNTDPAFDVIDTFDVDSNKYYYSHYPQLKIFLNNQDWNAICYSEFSTRAKLTNMLEDISKIQNLIGYLINNADKKFEHELDIVKYNQNQIENKLNAIFTKLCGRPIYNTEFNCCN